MHSKHSLLLNLVSSALAVAVPAPGTSTNTTLIARDLEWTNQPSTNPTCPTTDNKNNKDPATYTHADIAAAIEAAVNAVNADTLVDSTGKATYPHRNTPGASPKSGDSYADYNLEDCAQEKDDNAKKSGFLEFPILRSKQVYAGKPQDQGPDRVLFQFVTDNDKSVTRTMQPNLIGKFRYAAYCGIAEHVQNDKGQFLGPFKPCEHSNGNSGTSVPTSVPHSSSTSEATSTPTPTPAPTTPPPPPPKEKVCTVE